MVYVSRPVMAFSFGELGIVLCLYQKMYFCAMYNAWEFVIGKSYDEVMGN